jgi:hypothetical protein
VNWKCICFLLGRLFKSNNLLFSIKQSGLFWQTLLIGNHFHIIYTWSFIFPVLSNYSLHLWFSYILSFWQCTLTAKFPLSWRICYYSDHSISWSRDRCKHRMEKECLWKGNVTTIVPKISSTPPLSPLRCCFHIVDMICEIWLKCTIKDTHRYCVYWVNYASELKK